MFLCDASNELSIRHINSTAMIDGQSDVDLPEDLVFLHRLVELYLTGWAKLDGLV